MELSAEAQRVLGALAEKRLTTPQQYPLSLNALTAACNQRSAREPVMDLASDEVMAAIRELAEHELARRSAVKGRTARYEHRLDRHLGLDPASQTVLGVLLLRGPQTVGEIRTRTERWYPFADLDAVETTLQRLAAHALLPLVTELEREAGRRETRWAHLLGGDEPVAATPDAPVSSLPATIDADTLDLATRVTTLEAEVADLRATVDALRADLGLT